VSSLGLLCVQKIQNKHYPIFKCLIEYLKFNSMVTQKAEYWLRGPISGVPALLQPVAHSILQARDEIESGLIDFPDDRLWDQPVGVASVGFHLQHIPGVLDRLFTYARKDALTEEQLEYLANEGKRHDNSTVSILLQRLNKQVDIAIGQLKLTLEESLKDLRGVGRKQIPSTVAGLLFHAAEHTMRHTGQLIVTAKFVNG
jgi:hypothetical protein